jgi:hypothetical protein
MRRRELGPSELSIYSRLGQDKLSGLVPVYYSPNIDSLSSFPYKNSITPSVVSQSYASGVDESDSEDDLIKYDDDVAPIDAPAIPLPQLHSPDLLDATDWNWRAQYRRDLTFQSLLRTTSAAVLTDEDQTDQGQTKRVTNGFEGTIPQGSHIKVPQLASGFPVLPISPFACEKVSYGAPMASATLARVVLVACSLFPPLWLLMGTGYFDRAMGVIPFLEKRMALLLAFVSFLIVIACVTVGFALR